MRGKCFRVSIQLEKVQTPRRGAHSRQRVLVHLGGEFRSRDRAQACVEALKIVAESYALTRPDPDS